MKKDWKKSEVIFSAKRLKKKKSEKWNGNGKYLKNFCTLYNRWFLICQKHGENYDHFFTKLKSNVNLFWRQKDFRHQRKVFGKVCFSRKKAENFPMIWQMVIFEKNKFCQKLFFDVWNPFVFKTNLHLILIFWS